MVCYSACHLSPVSAIKSCSTPSAGVGVSYTTNIEIVSDLVATLMVTINKI